MTCKGHFGCKISKMVGPKKQDFWPKINILQGNHCILWIRRTPVRQKVGMILKNKMVQKLKFEKKSFFTNNGLLNCYSTMKKKSKKNSSIINIENQLWKYEFGTFWRTVIHCIHKIQWFPFSMLILGQRPCFLGPTIFEIPQPNWYHYKCITVSEYLLFA